jgi:hypothetical protein
VSLNRYAKKRDAVEREVFDALRDCGFSVEPLDRPCDALVGYRRRMWLVECKTGDKGYGKALNANQQKFADNWRGPPIVILRSATDAIDWAVQVSQEAA